MNQNIIHKWTITTLVCPNCKADVTFRYVYKKAQVKQGLFWTDIHSHAEIVLCEKCGDSVYIQSIKKLAEI